MGLVIDRNITGKIGDPFYAQGGLSPLSSGTPIIIESPYGFGVRAPQGQATGISASFTATNGPMIPDTIFRVKKSPETTITILQFRAGSSASHGVRVLTDGTVQLHSGSVLATSSTPIPYDTWLRLSLAINSAGTSLVAKIYPSVEATTPSITLSGSITATQVDSVRFAAVPASATDVDYAWPRVDNANEPQVRQYVGASLDQLSAIVPALVTCTASTLGIPTAGLLYTFRWGDGATTGPQSSRTAQHEYVTPGAYDVTVETT